MCNGVTAIAAMAAMAATAAPKVTILIGNNTRDNKTRRKKNVEKNTEKSGLLRRFALRTISTLGLM